MQKISIVTALAIAALFAGVPIAASAQISPGTTLVGTIDQNLSSNHVVPGEPFTMSNVHSTNYNINGAKLYGHVASAQSADQGRSGKITLAFDKVDTRSGNVYQIRAYATEIGLTTKSNALKTVGGAAAGALVGGLVGHGVGALLGAGAGAAVAANNRQNVLIPAGSLVSVKVVRSRRQSR
jgi:hypothetical protein